MLVPGHKAGIDPGPSWPAVVICLAIAAGLLIVGWLAA